MSYARRESVTVTTAADGSAEFYLPSTAGETFTGKLVNLILANTDLAGTSDITVTVEGTGQAVYSTTDDATSVTLAPRQSTHDTAGTVLTYTSDADVPSDYIVLAGDRIKIVVAQGGDTKSAAFTAIVA